MNYSPLRYPGGKAKLAPYIKSIIKSSNYEINTYIEPFAGGAGVAIDLLLSNSVERIIINDYDKAIYSFWRAVIEDTDALIDKIMNTDVTIEEWHRQKDIYTNKANKYSVELAFATFFLNRTNRSGILNAGPIGGLKQEGTYSIDARYNRKELVKKIKNIAARKKCIKVYNKEVRSFINQIVAKYDENAFVYFDPPYFVKGNRLYKNSLTLKDHKEISEHIKNNVQCNWIVTYDNVDEIKELYKDKYYRTYEFLYSINKSNVKKEIMIFKEKNICMNVNEKFTKISFVEESK